MIRNVQVVMERNPKLIEIITSCPKCDYMETSFFPKLLCQKCIHYPVKIVGQRIVEMKTMEEMERFLNKAIENGKKLDV